MFFGTDFGPGSMTKSGYPRIVKLWHRGEAIAAAATLLEGNDRRCRRQSASRCSTAMTASTPFIVRHAEFFDAEYLLCDRREARRWNCRCRASRAIARVCYDGQLLFTLRETGPWSGIPQGRAGRVFAEGLAGGEDAAQDFRSLHARSARSIDNVATGRERLYVSHPRQCHRHVCMSSRSTDGAWTTRSSICLPASGSADIISTNDFGPRGLFLASRAILMPPTLYADRRRRQAARDQVAAGAFRCVGH